MRRLEAHPFYCLPLSLSLVGSQQSAFPHRSRWFRLFSRPQSMRTVCFFSKPSNPHPPSDLSLHRAFLTLHLHAYYPLHIAAPLTQHVQLAGSSLPFPPPTVTSRTLQEGTHGTAQHSTAQHSPAWQGGLNGTQNGSAAQQSGISSARGFRHSPPEQSAAASAAGRARCLLRPLPAAPEPAAQPAGRTLAGAAPFQLALPSPAPWH